MNYNKFKIIFLLTVLSVLASNRALAWDFDKLKDNASGWVEKKKEETSGYINKKREESSDYFQKKKEDAYDWSSKKSREIKERGEEWSDKASNRIKKESEKVRDKTKSFYEDTKSKASSYIEKYKPEIQYKAEQARNEFSSFISNSDNQREIIEKVRGFGRAKQEIEISFIKSVPVYDPKDGKIKSFDRFMREMVGELGGDSLGEDLAKDPVRTGYLMCVDTDYFLKMNFIPGPKEDQWLSIDDALNAGYKTYDVKEMKEEYNAIKKAFREGNADNLNMHLNYFRRSLNKIQPQRRQVFLIKEKIKTITQHLAWIVIPLILLLIAGFSIKSFLNSSRAYCKQCNYKNEKGSKFCEKCGVILVKAKPFIQQTTPMRNYVWIIAVLFVFIILLVMISPLCLNKFFPIRNATKAVASRSIARVQTGSNSFCVDKEGTVIQQDGSSANFPMILIPKDEIAEIRTGDVFNSEQLQIALSLLRKINAKFNCKISEIDAIDKYDGLSFLMADGPEIKIGKENFDKKLKTLKGLLSRRDINLNNIEYIDLRFKNIYLKNKSVTREVPRVLTEEARWKICPDCNGTGKCLNCSGKGELLCKVCGGNGRYRATTNCSRCGGIQFRSGPKCHWCNSTGRINGARCGHCGGLGHCSKCGGSGVQYQTITCKKCGGKGEVVCNKCNGAGKCKTCGGKGKVLKKDR